MGGVRRFSALVLAVAVSGTLPSLAPVSSVPDAHAAGNDNTPWLLPTRPPQCLTKQISAGTVAGCLVSGYDAPDANGWPSPPFPSDAATGSDVAIIPYPGWTYTGYGYNGSPALANWEAQLATNQTAIGSVKANQIRSLPDAIPLFDGFLRDIQAGGYKVTDAYSYSFRCTSGTGKSCAGNTRDSLSNHSWGLAMDMNSGANPEMTYVGINGASACQTPVKTDIPQWVVQTAERWGLYWGGYGWNSGCDSPDQVKPSATRDATHFEFRGSPAQARAIAAVNLGDACIDVADDSGTIGPRCLGPGEVPGAGWRVVIDTKAPVGATAALVNLTETAAAAAGFITAESCGAIAAGPRTSSNGNVATGQTVANLAVVPIDSAGRFCLYRSQPMHTIVDVQGFFAPSKTAGPAGTLFTAVGPLRVIDTRTNPSASAPEMAVSASTVPSGAVAVLANLTVTEPVGTGYLTADACATLTAGPQTRSNANFAAGDTVANLAVVTVSAGTAGPEFCTYSSAQTQKVVDLQGYFAPPTAVGSTPGGWAYTSVPTQRLVDTRSCWSDPSGVQRCGLVNDRGSVIRIKAPAGASAVLINLTLTESVGDGFATAEACSLTQAPPAQSTGNIAKGRTSANLAVVPVDPDGTVCVVVSTAMHVIVDLQGTFSATGTSRFLPITPVRRSDTRVDGG